MAGGARPAAQPRLDIDAFKETKFVPDSPDVWAYLDDLRELKNRLFFGAIEEAAAELYA